MEAQGVGYIADDHSDFYNSIYQWPSTNHDCDYEDDQDQSAYPLAENRHALFC